MFAAEHRRPPYLLTSPTIDDVSVPLCRHRGADSRDLIGKASLPAKGKFITSG